MPDVPGHCGGHGSLATPTPPRKASAPSDSPCGVGRQEGLLTTPVGVAYWVTKPRVQGDSMRPFLPEAYARPATWGAGAHCAPTPDPAQSGLSLRS